MVPAWVKIRSWHIPSGVVSRAGRLHTLCGNWSATNAETSAEMPAGKTCESCFRNREIRDAA